MFDGGHELVENISKIILLSNNSENDLLRVEKILLFNQPHC